ncbi:MAG: hypothetical protein EOO10_13935 [Chitinophagaceae bacterium]|nr:MAG: hypothetical protein EOO10_13935 [Chitinophagaceae bacterium]
MERTAGEIKEIYSLNDQFNRDFEKLPQKKIQMFAGVNTEIADPEKAIALIAAWEQKRQKLFEKRYTQLYSWWVEQHATLVALAEETERISAHYTKAETASGIESLPLAIIDLQTRLWAAQHSLLSLTHFVFDVALLANASQKQAEENIAIYQAYKDGKY